MAQIDFSRIEMLARKWLDGTVDASERAEFMRWYDSRDDGQDIFIPERIADSEEVHRQRIWESIRTKMQKDAPAPVLSLRRKQVRWVAAAVLFLVVLAGGYFYWGQHANETVIALANDVKAPQTNRAMIALANGQKVYLDSLQNGRLAQQGGVQIIKLANGQVAYRKVDGTLSKELVYNTLDNPVGSQVAHLILADGTGVWLNAGSSLRYPVAFVGKERQVSITGEAYFEVVHDEAKPFMVNKGDLRVRVLGTHFNINTYEDEGNTKVTLLQGSVQVSKGAASGLLRPGQQADVGQEVNVLRHADLAQVMAWKEGRFVFDRTDIHATMRQIARWYDIQVQYRGNVTGFFSGSISRMANASQLLHMLELTGEAHFTLQGKTIIVSQ